MICPACGEGHPTEKRKTDYGVIQHHLWGHHRLEVIRSHEMAKKIIDGTFTEEDKAECNQLPLPIRG